jgi:hypothetical protein
VGSCEGEGIGASETEGAGVGSGVGVDVGDNMTFITVTVADISGVQIFTADEVSTVTVRDDEDAVE